MPIREHKKGFCEICDKPGQPMGYKGILCEKHGDVKYNSGMFGRKVGKKEKVNAMEHTTSSGHRVKPHSYFESGYNGELE